MTAADLVSSTALSASPHNGLFDALRRKPSAMITGLFDGFIFQTLLVFRPIYALRLGTSEERAIQYLTVCMLAGIPLQFLIGYLLDRVGAHAVLVLSCAVIAPRFSLSPGSLINRSPLGRFLRCVAEDQALSPRRHGSFHRQKDDGG